MGANGTFQHPVREESTSCSRYFREKWERNFQQIDKKLLLFY